MYLTSMPATTRSAQIEPAALFSAMGLKQNALTIQPRTHISILNKEKDIDRQFNFVITGKKIIKRDL